MQNLQASQYPQVFRGGMLIDEVEIVDSAYAGRSVRVLGRKARKKKNRADREARRMRCLDGYIRNKYSAKEGRKSYHKRLHIGEQCESVCVPHLTFNYGNIESVSRTQLSPAQREYFRSIGAM